MIFIPGVVISLITFPELLFMSSPINYSAEFYRVAIIDVCYLRTKNPSGYVIHEIPGKPGHNIMIGIGPLFVNTYLVH